MKFIKKWGILIVTLFFLAIIGVLLLIGFKAKGEYELTIENQENSINTMSSFIDNDIGPLVNCYVLTKPVRVGDIIEEDMLQEVSVPEKIAYTNKEVEVETTDESGNTVVTTENQRTMNLVLNKNDILGKKFRTELDEGAIILTDFVVDETVENSQRFYHLLLDDYPVDIQEGDYIDIRILLTYGEDFIALPHKRVEKLDLENGLFTFIFNEEEINIYNSMLLDYAMYPTVKIYALKYIDSTQQTSAQSYYPINNNIAEMVAINPNILNLVEKEMLLEREQLNAIMGGDTSTFEERELNQVQTEIAAYRRTLNQDITSAIRTRVRQEEEAARAAARG